MKLLIIISFLLSYTYSISQTNLDNLVLSELNEYRDSIKLNNLSFSEKCYSISKKQVELNSQRNIISHSGKSLGGEVVCYVSIKIPINSTNTNELISKQILKEWIESYEHNKLLTSSKFKNAGISTIIIEKGKVFHKGKMNNLYEVYSIINFY